MKKTKIIPTTSSDNDALKLGINDKKKWRNKAKIQKVKSSLLNKLWVREEIKRILKRNENEYLSYQNMWYTVKAVLKRKIIAMKPFIRKEESIYINDLTAQPKKLEHDQKE